VKPVLLDTGVIVALLDRRERYHAQCVDIVESLERPLVSCEAVIVESCYLLRALPGASQTVIQNIKQGVIQIPFQLSQSAAAVETLLRKYRDLPTSLADVSLIVLADQLNTGDILTLDRDFLTYRWRRNRPFQLLVEFSGEELGE
jgi:predicted nucleic acid-binding protein